jgi:hypothetical protein
MRDASRADLPSRSTSGSAALGATHRVPGDADAVAALHRAAHDAVVPDRWTCHSIRRPRDPSQPGSTPRCCVHVSEERDPSGEEKKWFFCCWCEHAFLAPSEAVPLPLPTPGTTHGPLARGLPTATEHDVITATT